MERVSTERSESCFYSHYFLILKKDGRTILNVRHLNRTLMRQPFRMLTMKQILKQIGLYQWI